MRLKIVDPPEWAGWASEKPTLVRLEEEEEEGKRRKGVGGGGDMERQRKHLVRSIRGLKREKQAAQALLEKEEERRKVVLPIGYVYLSSHPPTHPPKPYLSIQSIQQRIYPPNPYSTVAPPDHLLLLYPPNPPTHPPTHYSGSFKATSKTFFLLDRTHCSPNIHVSTSDFLTASLGAGGGGKSTHPPTYLPTHIWHRLVVLYFKSTIHPPTHPPTHPGGGGGYAGKSMVLGTKGFRQGLAYWEVRYAHPPTHPPTQSAHPTHPPTHPPTFPKQSRTSELGLRILRCRSSFFPRWVARLRLPQLPSRPSLWE